MLFFPTNAVAPISVLYFNFSFFLIFVVDHVRIGNGYKNQSLCFQTLKSYNKLGVIEVRRIMRRLMCIKVNK